MSVSVPPFTLSTHFASLGLHEGESEGENDGDKLGDQDGDKDGEIEGLKLGENDGLNDGLRLGAVVFADGECDGHTVRPRPPITWCCRCRWMSENGDCDGIGVGLTLGESGDAG